MRSERIKEARELHTKAQPMVGEPCCDACGAGSGWPCEVIELADALEAAETLAVVRNPPPEYYAEVLAEAHEEVACANRRAERAEADNAALLAELERLRAVAEAAKGCGYDDCTDPLCSALAAWEAVRRG